MKKRIAPMLNTLGWLMLFVAMVMGSVRDVGLDPQLYFDLQREAGVHETAGISEADLLQLDVNLARYLKGKQDDPNLEIEVFGAMQPAFNERELQHLADCRSLFAPTVSLWLNISLAVAGVALAMYGRQRPDVLKRYAAAMWIAAAVIVVPLALLAGWAVIDFGSAFDFFHRLLFANDLWMLNPANDLLIRICPESMFMEMGMRIGLRCGLILIGFPLVVSILDKLDKRKRKQNESAEL